MTYKQHECIDDANITTIEDVAFLVIARNEAFGIERCLRAICAMPLRRCRVICIDSNSTDETGSIMARYAKHYPDLITIHRCERCTNAAMARNAGLADIDKSLVFFVDGDVELDIAFVVTATAVLRDKHASMVTGELAEYRYTPDFTKIITEIPARKRITNTQTLFFAGGIFLMDATLLPRVGRWDESFIINEDIDFTLRISQITPGLALPMRMGIHHTRADHYTCRVWQFILNAYPMYFGMLIRRYAWRHPAGLLALIREEGVGLMGLITLLLLGCGIALRAWGVPSPRSWFPLAVFGAVDVLRTLTRRRSLLTHLLINYGFAPAILLGLFVDRPTHRPSRSSATPMTSQTPEGSLHAYHDGQ